jgi:non-ribosomal peptide synthetase component F
MKQQEAYWLKEFEGEVPLLNLPIDYPRPPLQSFKGSVVGFTLGEEETGILKTIAKEEQVTLYILLLSIYIVFLSKITGGKEDLVVGTGIAGRKHPALQKIIGMFVNTLALRSYPHSGKTFKTFLKEVKENTLLAFENQDYPFETLVDKVVKDRDQSRNPLVETLFMLQDMELGPGEKRDVEIPEIVIKYYGNEINTAKFDISFFCEQVENDLVFTVSYCTRLFKKETIEMLIRHFKEVVSFVSEDRDVRLKNVSLSSDLGIIKSNIVRDDPGDFGF